MQGFLLRRGKIGWSKYYRGAGVSEQGSPEKSLGLPKCDTYKYYGNMGYGVFKYGTEYQKGFCLRTDL